MMKGLILMKKTWPIQIDCPNCAAKLEAARAEGKEAVLKADAELRSKYH